MTQIHTAEGLCEGTGKRIWLFAGHGEKPLKKPVLPTPWSWISSLQICETMDFCCLTIQSWCFVKAALTA